MAEAFARAYGSDVLTPRSAGLTPAYMVSPLTGKVMEEKNVALEDAFPKPLVPEMLRQSDLVINMSGQPLNMGEATQTEEWTVRDPIGESEDVYREVASEIEQRVMQLVLKLRAAKNPPESHVGNGRAFDSRRKSPRK